MFLKFLKIVKTFQNWVIVHLPYTIIKVKKYKNTNKIYSRNEKLRCIDSTQSTQFHTYVLHNQQLSYEQSQGMILITHYSH